MMKTKLIATAVATAALSAAPAVAEAAKPMKYAGKTKEGTKISFVLDGRWVDRLDTMLPYSCVSAQGGPPTAGMERWAAPYKFSLGSVEEKVTVEEPWPAKHYTISVNGKRGRAISGKLAMSWSMLSYYDGGYRILTCQGTASFKVKPKK